MKLRLIVYGGLCLLVAFIALNWDNFLDHVDGLRAGQIDISFPFDAVSGQTTEVQLASQYGSDNWRCIDDPSHRLGPRQCHVDVRTVEGLRALVMIFFFRDGRLAHAKIDLLNWEHRGAMRMLLSRYGPPSGMQRQPVEGVRLIGWRTERGNVLYNIDRPPNPLVWNTVFWMSHREADVVGGLFKPRPASSP
jgi:hypothetical protein